MRRILAILAAGSLALVAIAVAARAISGRGASPDERAAMATRYAGMVRAPEFPRYAEWLNTARPYRMEDFRGKIVLLDFWTYCCINCIHIIPDLKKLEAKYPNELVVVGVHSAKFSTEKETDNIRQAIVRYEIAHPVVNDHKFELWHAYGVSAWPTAALVDPEGKVVGIHSGEGIFEALDPVIAEMVDHFAEAGTLDRRPIEIELEMARAPSSLLSFPGKLLADEPGGKLYISDSNHNRIIEATLPTANGAANGTGGAANSRVLRVFGSGAIGLADGSADSATFNHPQGMALDAERGFLYVADTENHAIRRIDLRAGAVATIAGTGEQARVLNRPGSGRTVALNSPWDLVLAGQTLYVAMAGSHQIWTLDLATGRAEPYAGSAREDRTDGLLARAALAQPSGLATDGRKLYVADSEVSAIRAVDLDPAGRVETVAGGELFEFGLKDDHGTDARFQHPIGVGYAAGTIYVADTYNNAIRAIDPVTGRVRTLYGDGTAGATDGRNPRFDEPNDVEIAAGRLWIADTNNHRIRVAPLAGGEVGTLAFANPEALLPRPMAADDAPAPANSIVLPKQTAAPGATEIVVDVAFPGANHLNAEAPSGWSVRALDGTVIGGPAEGRISAVPVRIPVTLREGMGEVAVDLVLYYCEEKANALCYFDDVRLRIPLDVKRGAGNGAIRARYRVDARM